MIKNSLSWFPLSPPFSLEEHLPGVLRPVGLFRSVPGPLAPLDLRRQRQLQLLLRNNAPVQRGTGTTSPVCRTSVHPSHHVILSRVQGDKTNIHVCSDPAGVGLFLCLPEERAPPHLRTVPEEERRLRGDARSEIKTRKEREKLSLQPNKHKTEEEEKRDS